MTSKIKVIRTIWGAVLLVSPQTVLGDLPHQRIDRPARVFARILGARHLVQTVITGRQATRAWIFSGAAVDGTHAATMVLFAWRRPDRRTLALTNVATAATLATAGVVDGLRGR